MVLSIHLNFELLESQLDHLPNIFVCSIIVVYYFKVQKGWVFHGVIRFWIKLIKDRCGI